MDGSTKTGPQRQTWASLPVIGGSALGCRMHSTVNCPICRQTFHQHDSSTTGRQSLYDLADLLVPTSTGTGPFVLKIPAA